MTPPGQEFDVILRPPDLARWEAGNTGLHGVWSFVAATPGPHVGITALMHGNEYAGAIVLAELLAAGPRPPHGTLTLAFLNLSAFARFDPRQPAASRFADEDMNRLWDPEVLDGPRQSLELSRARALLPLFDTVDTLLDLHTMLWQSDPLLLCGTPEKGRRLAAGIGVPALVVADGGHVAGRRLIDHPRFSSPDTAAAAVLAEAGQHWQPDAVVTTRAIVDGFLRHTFDAAAPPGDAQRYAEVTSVVTAATASFQFLDAFRGGEMVPRAGTVIAMDGATEIRTEHDDCLLVMPSLRPSRGQTAVRLARFVGS